MAAEVAQVARRCIDAKEGGALDLSDCSLTALPDAIFFMLSSGESILKCDLSGNSLKNISSKVPKHFDQLREFSCASNKVISKLPEEFSQLQHLTHLDISGNNFSSCPKPCASLKKLNLSNNAITHLSSDDIELLRALNEINLQGNDLDDETKELIKKHHTNFIV